MSDSTVQTVNGKSELSCKKRALQIDNSNLVGAVFAADALSAAVGKQYFAVERRHDIVFLLKIANNGYFFALVFADEYKVTVLRLAHYFKIAQFYCIA